MGELSEHWDDRYRTVGSANVSWFQAAPERSLHLIVDVLRTPRDAAIVDIGGGASALPDHLLGAGYRDITVVDISQQALDEAVERLGEAGDDVRWLRADLRTWVADTTYRLWHDRAVFHFLTSPQDQRHYWANVREHLAPGGFVVVATFAQDGPTACSGLPVCRYRPDELLAVMGDGFELVTSEREVHVTPGGGHQAFTWVVAKRI